MPADHTSIASDTDTNSLRKAGLHLPQDSKACQFLRRLRGLGKPTGDDVAGDTVQDTPFEPLPPLTNVTEAIGELSIPYVGVAHTPKHLISLVDTVELPSGSLDLDAVVNPEITPKEPLNIKDDSLSRPVPRLGQFGNIDDALSKLAEPELTLPGVETKVTAPEVETKVIVPEVGTKAPNGSPPRRGGRPDIIRNVSMSPGRSHAGLREDARSVPLSGNEAPPGHDHLTPAEEHTEEIRSFLRRRDQGIVSMCVLDSISPGEGQTLDRSDTGWLLQENQRLLAEVQDLTEALSKKSSPAVQQDDAVLDNQGLTTHEASKTEPGDQQVAELPQVITLRGLVFQKMFKSRMPTDHSANSGTPTITLDTPLSSNQVAHFLSVMDDISPRNLPQPIAFCALCHLPKFKEARGTVEGTFLSEMVYMSPSLSSSLEDFHPFWGTTDCCRKFVCKACLAAAVISGIRTHWWYDLMYIESPWLKCPVPCCRHSLPLQYNCDVLGLLQTVNASDAVAHTQQFDRANSLRAALQALSPWPTKQESHRAIALHDRLVRHGRMWPLLTTQDTPASDAQVGPIEVAMLPVDTPDGQGTMQIPIFTHLLRPRISRDCIVCSETYEEFDRGKSQAWDKATKGFKGEWTWRILSFPAPEILPECHHERNICRTCIATHIGTQLESHGRNAIDKITCPAPECGHKLTHTEIRNLATPETFTMYDRYATLNTISVLPNFRWCLREGCTFGGVYGDPTSPTTSPTTSTFRNPNHIMCSECTYGMCYTCQVPWHHSLTCAQYKSLKSHGDPQYTQTQEWISKNTKSCPGEGCGVPVQKGQGCFHMTCSECRHEFCWECLADWSGILINGEFSVEGHREGCYFRTEDAVLPTQVMGRNLDRGLRRLAADPDAVL